MTPIILAAAAVLIIAVTGTVFYVLGYLRGYRNGTERGHHAPRHAAEVTDPTVTRPDPIEVTS